MVDYGGSRHFATTRWSIVLAAGAGPVRADAREALASLCETYWYPLYAYLRGRGHSAEDAEDLTQAFFARVFEKETFRQADPARGKFRSFLLTALKNFAVNEHDRHTAQKRGGGVPVVSLEFEGAEGRYQREPSTAETPERIFDRTWALTLLDRVMSRLADDAERRSKRVQFDSLKPFLIGDGPQVGYAAVARTLGMSEGAVKVAVHRLRTHFRDLVREEIAQTVASPDDIEGELQYLRSAIAR